MTAGTTADEPGLILVVDDEPAVRELFARTLQRAGFDTLEAPDGLAALEMVRRHPVSLVLLDSSMPRLDGPGVVARLRERRRR